MLLMCASGEAGSPAGVACSLGAERRTGQSALGSTLRKPVAAAVNGRAMLHRLEEGRTEPIRTPASPRRKVELQRSHRAAVRDSSLPGRLGSIGGGSGGGEAGMGAEAECAQRASRSAWLTAPARVGLAELVLNVNAPPR